MQSVKEETEIHNATGYWEINKNGEGFFLLFGWYEHSIDDDLQLEDIRITYVLNTAI